MRTISRIKPLLFVIASLCLACDLSAAQLRVATFNVSIEAGNFLPHTGLAKNPEKSVLVQEHLSTGTHDQIKNIAEIIQRTRPDVILLNEFDYTQDSNKSVDAFIKNYLNVSQNSQESIHYPYSYAGPVNTGVVSPFDINGDGHNSSLPGDAYGFGYYPGQYGMAILSKYQIELDQIRSLQHFLWKDMPEAKIPLNEAGIGWYSQPAWNNFRLPSKSHWDVPINIDGEIIHIIASHPTPPVFDGPEDRNGKRNHDEIRLIADYISNESYIYDDKGQQGGLVNGSRFVVVGDMNASPVEGDALKGAIGTLLDSELIDASCTPLSDGAKQNKPDSEFAETHTAAWGLRVDYVLPSKSGFEIENCGVFWPIQDSNLGYLVTDRSSSSDHRLVWVDLKLTNLP